MSTRSEARGRRLRGGYAGRCWSLCLAIAMLGLPFALDSARAQNAGATNEDAGTDGQEFLFDLLYGMPSRDPEVPEPSYVATAPGAEQQAPRPAFYVWTLAPLNYTSNADWQRSGGTETLEGSPEVRLGLVTPVFDLPLRFSTSVAVEWDRFVESNPGEFDKVRPRAQLQYVDAENDQAFSPFLGFSPRWDYTPTFDDNFATRYDLNLGVSKAFNFGEGLALLPPSSNSSRDAGLRLGFTLIGQRRFRHPAPESWAFMFIPSVAYRISDDWSTALGIEMTRRWFESVNAVDQRNFTLEPVLALQYQIPESWLGADTTSWLGRPRIDLFAGVEQNWSNVFRGQFTRAYAGMAFRTAWNF
jgi:hypothetical protein